jgi:integrase
MHEQGTQPRVDQRGSREKVERGIWRRGGKWIVGFQDVDSTWRTKTVQARNLTEAREEREKLRVEVRAGVAPAPTKLTLDAVAADFFETFEGLVAAGDKSPRTLDVYKQQYTTHIKPTVGRLKVQQLRGEHVSRVLAELRRKGLSSWTVQGVYKVLSLILGHAMTRDLIAESPVKRLAKAERPHGRNKTAARRLTSEEVDKLIAHAIPSYKAAIHTAAVTGCRISELLGLRWQDVDLEQRVIRVRHQLSRGTKEEPATLVPLKTEAGKRDVPIVPELHDRLKRHREQAFSRGTTSPRTSSSQR